MYEGLILAEMSRGGVIESSHYGSVVVVTPTGDVLLQLGTTTAPMYPRSAIKPFQAAATLGAVRDAGGTPVPQQTAIACASHTGSNNHQIEAAGILAEADTNEDALLCPPAWPKDEQVRSELSVKTSLSHNCSGKHAAMIWGQISLGSAADHYLDPTSAIQRRISTRLEIDLGSPPEGPSVDGCGAPAWRTTLEQLAKAFGRLSEGVGELETIRNAMQDHPVLVGGVTCADTQMMVTDERVVAKRGAEGVLGVGFMHPVWGPLGVAVKIHDGAGRAAGTAAATVCHALGAAIPTDLLDTPVLGGEQKQGLLRTPDSVRELIRHHLQKATS